VFSKIRFGFPGIPSDDHGGQYTRGKSRFPPLPESAARRTAAPYWAC
jgi:hypothetical protein